MRPIPLRLRATFTALLTFACLVTHAPRTNAAADDDDGAPTAPGGPSSKRTG